MSYNYSPFVKLANRQIARFGKNSVLRKVTNTGTEDVPVLTPSDTDMKMVTFENWVRDESGTLTGDKRAEAMLSTEAGVLPAKSDKVAFNVRAAEVDENTQFFEIVGILEQEPGPDRIYSEVMVAT